jgi:SAM-dependent methyltransferase
MTNQREFIGRTLTGDVLEIGPGARPYPTTAPGARVSYADRSVEGGRRLNWPELRGAPDGPNADFDIDLDRDGLQVLNDASRDAVIASHVIEHLANPVAALVEFQRVLRPGGRLVLIVPDREHTFDWVREPTPFAHLWNEYRSGTIEVSEAHITEYCRSIYMQSPVHPPQVRAWHDPKALTAGLLALHRRRSIHVHCWSPEEFASLLANLLREGVLDFELAHAYFCEDLPGGCGDEFGFVLVKPASPVPPPAAAQRFIQDWCRLALDTSRAPPRRLQDFAGALRRDLPVASQALGALPAEVLTQRWLNAPVRRLKPRDLRKLALRGRQALRELLIPASRPELPRVDVGH